MEARQPMLNTHDQEYTQKIYLNFIGRLVAANKMELVNVYMKKLSSMTKEVNAMNVRNN